MIHFHGGPFAGQWHDIVLPIRVSRLNDDGTVLSVDTRTDGRRWVGQYVQDQNSDRGQDWDWVE